VALVLSSLFLAVGAGFVMLFFGLSAIKSWQALSWEQARCTIVSGRVGRYGGDTYRLQMIYTYTHGGIVYTGTQANFDEGGSSDWASKERVVDRLRPGTSSPCWVNPRRPDEAVLDRGITGDTWFGLIPGIFVLFGALGLYYSFRPVPAWLVRAAAAGEAAAARSAR
jgi:hypothetical protein